MVDNLHSEYSICAYTHTQRERKNNVKKKALLHSFGTATSENNQNQPAHSSSIIYGHNTILMASQTYLKMQEV